MESHDHKSFCGFGSGDELISRRSPSNPRKMNSFRGLRFFLFFSLVPGRRDGGPTVLHALALADHGRRRGGRGWRWLADFLLSSRCQMAGGDSLSWRLPPLSCVSSNNNSNKVQTGCVAIVKSPQFCTFIWSQVHGEHVSAARRRRERLGRFLRHERLSVALALAEMQHHTAPRGQNMARGWGGGARAALHATATALLLTRRQVRCTLRWTLTMECLPPEAPGQTGSLLCLVRRSGFCGARSSMFRAARGERRRCWAPASCVSGSLFLRLGSSGHRLRSTRILPRWSVHGDALHCW